MLRYTAGLAASLALTGSGAVVLETASRNAPAPSPTAPSSTASSLSEPRPAPAWANRSWLNTDHPLTLAELRGRVVLLNFWVFTCYNCTNTVPSLVRFDQTYRRRGLTLIGIHTPEFPPYAGEHDRGNVEKALGQYGIEYPNAQDNDTKTWDLYRIRFWPSFVLIDKQGRIRYEGYGEFHNDDASYKRWAGRIEELLGE